MKNLYKAIARLKHSYNWAADNSSPKATEIARKNYHDVKTGVEELQKIINQQQQQIEALELAQLEIENNHHLNNKSLEIEFLTKYAVLRGLNLNEVFILPLRRFKVNGLNKHLINYKQAIEVLNSILENNTPQDYSLKAIQQAFITYNAYQMLPTQNNLIAPVNHNIYLKIN